MYLVHLPQFPHFEITCTCVRIIPLTNLTAQLCKRKINVKTISKLSVLLGP